MSEPCDLKVEDPEVLQTQMQASIGFIRSMISNYVKNEDVQKNFKDAPEAFSYTVHRPERLGVGAKYLSHNAAVNSFKFLSNSDQALKNKMFKGKKSDQFKSNTPANVKRNYKTIATEEAESSEEEGKFSSKKSTTNKIQSISHKKAKINSSVKDVTNSYLNSQSKRALVIHSDLPALKKKKSG